MTAGGTGHREAVLIDRKRAVRDKVYRYSRGMDRRIESLWGEQAHSGIEKH